MAFLQTNKAFRQVFANNKELNCITDQQAARLKLVLMEMMDDIVSVCEGHGLTYYLTGGCALGAVRHQGFIPWDDDIDVGMFRKDYDLFIKYMKEELSDKYWIQYICDNPKYESNYLKIRKKNTRFVELFEPNPERAGICIDIFPIEDTYDSTFRRKIHGYRCEFLLLVCSCVRLIGLQDRILPYLEDKATIKTVKTKCFIGKCFGFWSLHKWLCHTEKVLSSCRNENSEFVTIPTGCNHYFGEMYHRSAFVPAKQVKFEDRTYNIMNDPDEYLSKMYGDYMKIPEGEPERHSILELEF